MTAAILASILSSYGTCPRTHTHGTTCFATGNCGCDNVAATVCWQRYAKMMSVINDIYVSQGYRYAGAISTQDFIAYTDGRHADIGRNQSAVLKAVVDNTGIAVVYNAKTGEPDYALYKNPCGGFVSIFLF